MMYVKTEIDRLVSFIQARHGINNKARLAECVQREFGLTLDRKVYTGEYFSIRFSKAEKRKMSNTVLSLSALEKYDGKPFFVCVVTPQRNYLLLANTTFLKKISHSSQALRIDNIKGSFNGSDIVDSFCGLENRPENFEELYAAHCGFSFEENLERLVESTNGIVGRSSAFQMTEAAKANLENAVDRAQKFVSSAEYRDLKQDLDTRVQRAQGEIAIASLIDNVNLRGRVIEYLITDNGSSLKEQIISALQQHSPLPKFKTKDGLGDYTKEYPAYHTETDIKTKVLFLSGNPKAYNVDKLLEFLSTDRSVYMVYLLGIDGGGNIIARLCSVFDDRLIAATRVVPHWAGRNSRGVAQFSGAALEEILRQPEGGWIHSQMAEGFLAKLVQGESC